MKPCNVWVRKKSNRARCPFPLSSFCSFRFVACISTSVAVTRYLKDIESIEATNLRSTTGALREVVLHIQQLWVELNSASHNLVRILCLRHLTPQEKKRGTHLIKKLVRRVGMTLLLKKFLVILSLFIIMLTLNQFGGRQ